MARPEADLCRGPIAGAEPSRQPERSTRIEAAIGARVAPVHAGQWSGARRGGLGGRRGLRCRTGRRARHWARVPRASDACAAHPAAESVEGAQWEAGRLVLRERTHEETGGGHLRLRAARRRHVVLLRLVAAEAAGRSSDRRANARAVRLVRRRIRTETLAALQERHGCHLQEVHKAAAIRVQKLA